METEILTLVQALRLSIKAWTIRSQYELQSEADAKIDEDPELNSLKSKYVLCEYQCQLHAYDTVTVCEGCPMIMNKMTCSNRDSLFHRYTSYGDKKESAKKILNHLKLMLKKLITVSRKNCETADQFEHKTYKNADNTPGRARRNGKTKVWKTKPKEFKIPIKVGLSGHDYITQENCNDWIVAE